MTICRLSNFNGDWDKWWFFGAVYDKQGELVEYYRSKIHKTKAASHSALKAFLKKRDIKEYTLTTGQQGRSNEELREMKEKKGKL